jgi:hypothetical protein
MALQYTVVYQLVYNILAFFTAVFWIRIRIQLVTWIRIQEV